MMMTNCTTTNWITLFRDSQNEDNEGEVCGGVDQRTRFSRLDWGGNTYWVGWNSIGFTPPPKILFVTPPPVEWEAERGSWVWNTVPAVAVAVNTIDSNVEVIIRGLLVARSVKEREERGRKERGRSFGLQEPLSPMYALDPGLVLFLIQCQSGSLIACQFLRFESV